MSKELEALANLYARLETTQAKLWEQDYHIIETALKQYNAIMEQKEDIINNNRALEIIKKKGNFISLEYDEYDDKYYIYDNELYMHNEITQEEYNLLKEVLL